MILKQGGAFVTKWEDEFVIKYKLMISEGIINTKGILVITIDEDESWFGGLVGGGSGKKTHRTDKKVPAIPSELTNKSQTLINNGFKQNKKQEQLNY